MEGDERAFLASTWTLKEINFPPGHDKRVKIVLQNRNGPCSLLALCNVLLLRGEIQVLPPDRQYVSYEYLSCVIADYLLEKHPNDVGITEALGSLPNLYVQFRHDKSRKSRTRTASLLLLLNCWVSLYRQFGINLNPSFNSCAEFGVQKEGGPLKLFDLCGVKIVHGWLVDPNSSSYSLITQMGYFEKAQDFIVAATQEPEREDEHCKLSEHASSDLISSIRIQEFLDVNQSQLTYHGLFELSNLLAGLYALLRNSHISVLLVHSPTEQQKQLMGLVTDLTLAQVPYIVWESLTDVDGSGSSFVDANLSIVRPEYRPQALSSTLPPPAELSPALQATTSSELPRQVALQSVGITASTAVEETVASSHIRSSAAAVKNAKSDPRLHIPMAKQSSKSSKKPCSIQ